VELKKETPMLDLLSANEIFLLAVFFVTSMMSIGMQTRPADLASVFSERSYLARALLANFVVLPVLGVAIVLILPIQPPVAGAILLLACTPGGWSAIQFTGQVGSVVTLGSGVLFLLSFLAVFVSPWILKLLLPGDVQLVIPFGQALRFLLVLLVLPLMLGMILLARVPVVARKLSKPVLLVGVISFVAWMVTSGSWRKEAAAQIGGGGVAAILLLIFLSMAIGWLMGGPSHEKRQVLATSTSMRNAGLCFGIVTATQPGHPVEVPLIAFSMLMVFPNMLFTVYHSVRGKRRAGKAS
jgi:BASS family bile acid:Na+ symporter